MWNDTWEVDNRTPTRMRLKTPFKLPAPQRGIVYKNHFRWTPCLDQEGISENHS